MRRLVACTLLAVSALGAAAGCSLNKVSKEDFNQELIDAGIPSELATCVTDKLAAQGFDFRRYGEVSAEESAQVETASGDCVKEGVDISGLTVPE